MLRNAAALMSVGLLLHLNVLSVARECASPHELTTTEHSEHADHPSRSQSPPSQSQSQSQCCDVMSSCAVTLELGADREMLSAIALAGEVAVPNDAAHTAARRAPDPPPPRVLA